MSISHPEKFRNITWFRTMNGVDEKIKNIERLHKILLRLEEMLF